MHENEEQRSGRNKETLINRRYINSGEYRKKFDFISNNKDLSRLLYSITKEMLIHRSGTLYEDMYWIDLDTISVVAREIKSIEPKRIEYSSFTKKIIQNYKGLLTIHTHPDSFPPSIDDFNSNFDHNYSIGLVACHDGKIYMYSANERLNENYYKLVVEEYIKNGYNESEAQYVALQEIQQNFDINFKEVVANDGI